MFMVFLYTQYHLYMLSYFVTNHTTYYIYSEEYCEEYILWNSKCNSHTLSVRKSLSISHLNLNISYDITSLYRLVNSCVGWILPYTDVCYSSVYSVLSECLWKNFTGDSGGIRTHVYQPMSVYFIHRFDRIITHVQAIRTFIKYPHSVKAFQVKNSKVNSRE